MTSIPNKRAVSQALKSTRRALKQTIKEINQSAADLAKKGTYERAEEAMSKGRELMQFREVVLGIERRWKEVCGSVDSTDKASNEVALAAWQYYTPIARCLVALGGKASLSELEAEFIRQMDSRLRTGDHSPMAGGRERWQTMIRRARKHMVKEGWVLSKSAKVWEISSSGRQVAEKQTE